MWPLDRAIEQDQVLWLEPGSEVETALCASIVTDTVAIPALRETA
jgi:hypothetical protein